jgi:hypothetical protein
MFSWVITEKLEYKYVEYFTYYTITGGIVTINILPNELSRFNSMHVN